MKDHKYMKDPIGMSEIKKKYFKMCDYGGTYYGYYTGIRLFRKYYKLNIETYKVESLHWLCTSTDSVSITKEEWDEISTPPCGCDNPNIQKGKTIILSLALKKRYPDLNIYSDQHGYLYTEGGVQLYCGDLTKDVRTEACLNCKTCVTLHELFKILDSRIEEVRDEISAIDLVENICRKGGEII